MTKKPVGFYLNMFLVGGIETSLLEYLNNLDATAFDITLIIGIKMYDGEAFHSRLKQHIKIKYVIDSKFLCMPFYKKKLGKLSYTHKFLDNAFILPVRSIIFKKRLIKMLNQFDTIIDYSLSLTKIAKHITGKKIGFFHFSLKKYYAVSTKKIQKIEHAMAYYDKLVVLNQHMLQEATELLPQFIAKFYLMYNQIDFDNLRQLANRHDAENKLYDNYIVSVGRLEENQKDFTTLIKAHKTLQEQYHHTEQLIIVGDGKDRHKLQTLIDSLGLSAAVKLVGNKVNPFPWIKNSQLFVFSSKFEGMPMVLAEAMVLGKAVVATDCPHGPRDALLNGECGVLTKTGAANELANAMHRVLSDKKFEQTLIDNANLKLNRFNIKTNIHYLAKIIANPT